MVLKALFSGVLYKTCVIYVCRWVQLGTTTLFRLSVSLWDKKRLCCKTIKI